MPGKINESAPRPGKTVYGAALGILMLDTTFPRIHGDIGNAETWPFPVIYKIVDGATSDKVVRKGAAGQKDDFAKAAKEVVSMGADGIGNVRVPIALPRRYCGGCGCSGCKFLPHASSLGR